MLVAVCDDERVFREDVCARARDYGAQRRIALDIHQFSRGADLLEDPRRFDLVFLDYQMPGLDGMEVARQLRLKNAACGIVFITSYPRFVLESFEVQPFRFLLKPVQPEQIVQTMDDFIARQRRLCPITVLQGDRQIMVDASQILYLEGDGKNCLIRTPDETYTSARTLAQVHELLPQYCFFRTHRSFVVGLYHIRSFDKTTVTLVNGEVAKLGRSHAGQFRQVYAQFVKDYYIKV